MFGERSCDGVSGTASIYLLVMVQRGAVVEAVMKVRLIECEGLLQC